MDDLDLSSPPPGKYPYRFTQDDRFQYRVKVQPAGDSLEFVVRSADTRRYADADYRSFHGVPRGVKRAAPIDDDDTRDIDAASQDVQSAISAASSDSRPKFCDAPRKVFIVPHLQNSRCRAAPARGRRRVAGVLFSFRAPAGAP